MSISLSNHEDRIKVLEGKTSAITYETDFTLNDRNHMNMSFKDASGDLFIFMFDQSVHDNDYGYIVTDGCVVVSKSTKTKIQTWGKGNFFTAGVISIENGVISFFAGNGYTKVVRGHIIALKLYYNFSYNIYCLICTFLEFLFKEV